MTIRKTLRFLWGAGVVAKDLALTAWDLARHPDERDAMRAMLHDFFFPGDGK